MSGVLMVWGIWACLLYILCGVCYVWCDDGVVYGIYSVMMVCCMVYMV